MVLQSAALADTDLILDYYSFRLITLTNEVRRPRLYTVSYIGSRASRRSVILGLGITMVLHTRLRLGYYLRIITYLSHGQHLLLHHQYLSV